jgi:hypothetical protein
MLRAQMKQELRSAHLHASLGAMNRAESHLVAALKLFDAAPLGQLPWSVGRYIVEAGQAGLKPDRPVALRAIDAALQELEEAPGWQGE